MTSPRGAASAPAASPTTPRAFHTGRTPGAYEASLGSRGTSELAVMLDTIRPLSATADAIEVEDPGYQDSFIASPGSGPGSA
ncbi:hypothetical protein WMF45_12100 [Sorangium sp. So ce448]